MNRLISVNQASWVRVWRNEQGLDMFDAMRFGYTHEESDIDVLPSGLNLSNHSMIARHSKKVYLSCVTLLTASRFL